MHLANLVVYETSLRCCHELPLPLEVEGGKVVQVGNRVVHVLLRGDGLHGTGRGVDRNRVAYRHDVVGSRACELTEYEYALVSLNRRFRCVELAEDEAALIVDFRKCGKASKARIAQLARELSGSAQ